jgi:GNAT superfamily N-acetyltransferase
VSGALEWRAAQPGQADEVRDLTRRAYAKWVGLIGREPRPMTADYEAALRDHRFDLIYRDGTLVGLIETSDEGDHLLIVNIAVAPEAQGQGLGRGLVAHAEGLARALGRGVVRLYTNQLFAENVRLYQRLCYGIDEETTDPVLGTTVYMSKRL